MKKSLLLFITGLTLLWSAKCIAAPGELGDNGGANSNPHNLSAVLGNTNPKKALTETQICIFCHTPHGATPQSTLWNRPDPAGPNPPGDGTFPIRANLHISDPAIPGGYDTTHYGDNTTAGFEYPNGSSKLCLSCHDGVTAMGILADGTEIEMTPSGLATEVILSTSHPISFIYIDSVVTHLNNNYGAGSYKLPGAGYLDGSNRVQCTSCHQPHQDTRDGGANPTDLPFWRYGNGVPGTDYDPVCLECHQAGSYGLPGPKEHQY